MSEKVMFPIPAISFIIYFLPHYLCLYVPSFCSDNLHVLAGMHSFIYTLIKCCTVRRRYYAVAMGEVRQAVVVVVLASSTAGFPQ